MFKQASINMSVADLLRAYLGNLADELGKLWQAHTVKVREPKDMKQWVLGFILTKGSEYFDRFVTLDLEGDSKGFFFEVKIRYIDGERPVVKEVTKGFLSFKLTPQGGARAINNEWESAHYTY